MGNLAFAEIKAELEQLLEKKNISEHLAQVSLEQGEFTLRLFPEDLTERDFQDAMILAKKSHDNWRIHTFEKGFISIQALNKNIFQTDGLLDNMKIRLSALSGEKTIEITKKGEVDVGEVALMHSFIVRYCTASDRDLFVRLEEAGCQVYKPENESWSFSDFAGYAEVKQRVMETVVLPIQHPHVYEEIAKSTRKKYESIRPKAILFDGPPGVGKTTMARILARETGYVLVYVPLENLMSAYYGESSKKLAAIFDIAAESPENGLIIFLDEIDALAQSRNDNLFEATRRLLSVLLRKIDGIESKDNYITVGATNRSSDLDPALMSRFDTIVTFPLPSTEDIESILQLNAIHLSDTEVSTLAKKMTGYSPRTIRDICRRAERIQARISILEQKKVEAPPLSTYITALSQVPLG